MIHTLLVVSVVYLLVISRGGIGICKVRTEGFDVVCVCAFEAVGDEFSFTLCQELCGSRIIVDEKVGTCSYYYSEKTLLFSHFVSWNSPNTTSFLRNLEQELTIIKIHDHPLFPPVPLINPIP